MSNILHRRHFLLTAAAASTGLAGLAGPARAERTVRILVGFPPGQATDTVARLMAEKLRAETGDNYIVENKPGQGGSLGLGELAKAPVDGSVMMLAHMSALATNPHLYRTVPYDPLKDFQPVGLVGDLPFVLVCNPSLPVKSLPELVAYAKARPDELTNASSGNGTVSHLAMEELKRRAGMKIVHVPYKGSGPGLTDVMSGTVSIALETAASVQPLVQSGKLRALAVAMPRRLGGVLAVPTVAESGFANFAASTWLMLLYPARTPEAQAQATFGALGKAFRTAEVDRRLQSIGCLPRSSSSPAEALAYLRSEFQHWGELVKRSGVTLDG
jgi:tripartite-type tricarboxylate transporter receptor subunit TctC